MPKEPRITIDILVDFDRKAREQLSKETLTAQDYLRLAQRSEEGGRNFSAAVYYHLAALAVGSSREARLYEILSEEMRDRISLGRSGEE
jgi:hypothetical protein